MTDVLKSKFRVSHTASTERKLYQVIFLRLLDYNVRHDDRFVHKIRITAENVKYHERGENICFFQNSDSQ